MRIAIIYRDFDSSVGDAHDVRNIALNLVRLNNKVEIYCSKNCKNSISHPNLTYYRRRYSFFSVLDLFLRRKNVDFAHLFCGFIISLFWISLLLRFVKVPYCYSGFGQVSEKGFERSFLRKKLYLVLCLRSIVKNASFIQACSSHESDYLQRIGANKAVIAPLSIEGYELYEPKIISDQKLITFIGRLDIWQKGLDLLLAVTEELAPCLRKKGYRIILAGRTDAANLERLTLSVEKYKLTDLVSIRVDVTEAEKLRLLSATDIFYHPSRIEGFARSMREALSMKIPTLTTFGSNIGDTIMKYQVGLSTEFDVNEQVIALSKLLENQDLNSDWNGLFKYLRWSNTANILQTEYLKYRSTNK